MSFFLESSSSRASPLGLAEMAPQTHSHDVDGLLQIANWVSYLALTGLGLAASVYVLRFLKQPKFKVGQLKLPISKFSYLAFAFTAAHLYLMGLFLQKVMAVRQAGVAASRDAWARLINSGGFIFAGMHPRIWTTAGGPFGMGGYVAAFNDLAFWVKVAYSLLLIGAIALSLLPDTAKRRPSPRQILWVLAVGCVVASMNWIIGSRWAIAASSLHG